MEFIQSTLRVFELVEKLEIGKAEEALSWIKGQSGGFKELGRCRILIENMDLEQAKEIIERLEYELASTNTKETLDFFRTFIEVCKCLLEFHKNHMETARGIFEEIIGSKYSQAFLIHVRSILSRVCKVGIFSVSEEKEKFLQCFHSNFNVTPNSTWHVVASEWFLQWCSHVGAKKEDFSSTFPVISKLASKRPGPIDNTSVLMKVNEEEYLQDPTHPYFMYTLKPGLTEGIDYVVIPHSAFEIIGNSYGVKQDIVRHVIEQNDTIYQIEIYLKTVKVGFLSGSKLFIKNLNISRKNTLGYIKKLVLKTQNIQSRVWKLDTAKLPLTRLRALANKTFLTYLNGAVVLDESLVIDDAELSESNLLLIEVNFKNKYVYSDDPSLMVNKCQYCQASSQAVPCKQCKRKLYCTSECLLYELCESIGFDWCCQRCRESNQKECRCFI